MDEADRILKADGGNLANQIEQAVKFREMASENITIRGGIQEKGPIQFPQIPLHRLLFSATLSHDPEQLQQLNLYRPKLFIVSSASVSHTSDGQGALLKKGMCIYFILFIDLGWQCHLQYTV